MPGCGLRYSVKRARTVDACAARAMGLLDPPQEAIDRRKFSRERTEVAVMRDELLRWRFYNIMLRQLALHLEMPIDAAMFE